jgi:hypothetical protein
VFEEKETKFFKRFGACRSVVPLFAKQSPCVFGAGAFSLIIEAKRLSRTAGAISEFC